MKIAFVDEDLSPRTGSRRFTIEVTRQLQSLGHEVKIFTTMLDKEKCFHEYLSMPIEIVPYKASAKIDTMSPKLTPLKKNAFLSIVDNFTYSINHAKLALRLSQKIAESHCDVTLFQYHGEHWLLPYFYHVRDSTGMIYLNVIPPQPRPFALPFQELTMYGRMIEGLYKLPPVGRWEKLSYRKLAKFITPSKFQLKEAERLGIIGTKEAEVVPLGVDHSKFCPTGEEESYALYLGRINPHKSLELAIMAMKNAPANYSLIIAGDIDKRNLTYKDRLISLAEEMKISDKLRLILFPSDSEVVHLMQKCSLFLFPSTIDTFGLVVLEAMACGKPIVACKRGGVPEIVDEASGFLIEPSPEQWQRTVCRLLSDSAFRRKMGEKALKRSKAFSWEKVAENLLSTFKGVAA